jgi:hypothetical protein
MLLSSLPKYELSQLVKSLIYHGINQIEGAKLPYYLSIFMLKRTKMSQKSLYNAALCFARKGDSKHFLQCMNRVDKQPSHSLEMFSAAIVGGNVSIYEYVENNYGGKEMLSYEEYENEIPCLVRTAALLKHEKILRVFPQIGSTLPFSDDIENLVDVSTDMLKIIIEKEVARSNIE